MKGRRQEAGIDGDLNPHLTEDRQIKILAGDLNPVGQGKKALLLTKIFPPAFCPLPPASPEGLLKLIPLAWGHEYLKALSDDEKSQMW